MELNKAASVVTKVGPWAWWRSWWHRQSPNRQDRYANLAPVVAVVLFLAAIASAFWYLRVEEIEREQEAIKRDVEYAQQRLRLRLLERQEQVMRLARDVSNKEIRTDQFLSRAEALVQQYPEFLSLTWIDDRRRIIANQSVSSISPSQHMRAGTVLKVGETESHFSLARDLMQPIYGQINTDVDKDAQLAVLQLHTPLSNDQGRFSGVILAEYTMEGLLRYGIPTEVLAKYAVALQDGKGQLLAGQTIPGRIALWRLLPGSDKPNNDYEVPVSPVGNDLILRAQAWRTSQGLVGGGLFWLVSVLSVMTAWMLIGNWRHTRRRIQAQKALVAETNFRRAMENSMLTGMRALDLRGRITYVNPAFCQMTGWSESDLVGAVAPFPYWPDQDRELLMKRLEEEISGQHSAGGFQVRVKRKNGQLFDARMYVSPLIDATGKQTGWMTSMTDITEPNRIREQLASSHERFTIVLEALDASVSVAPLGSEELLFANKLYRLWFGQNTVGHLRLVQQAGATDSNDRAEENDDVDEMAGLPTESLTVAKSENSEIFVSELGKWLEVRSRYINWADGRLAQMVIASDITPRRQAEELAAQQAERAQNASRLITMGEMASSVAHELNQPLTAISNYCSGMISRIKSQQVKEEDLLSALDKTARQAQRAGQIILRIRSFVKRSEPNRTLSDVSAMVSEALELAEIEMRRRNVRLTHHVAARLPQLMVDPILIEQVLINLMKNAAESIDNANRPAGQRHVELRIVPRQIDNQSVVEFSVTDTGQGLPPEDTERVYEAFFSTKVEGMGIGLNLCRSIIESHQGRIVSENLYNAGEVTGCRFSFWIPVEAALTT
ncbi:PAS domain-containing sensor histidine kinase [Limnohabitans sp. Hippo3]|uniref:PAS domain-containing sensor histidine kinase n=1 Tax=Limnohabitans sp. Hippo3 TaxID=1597956 RepID=UPI000D383633|nr:PAS domain-containing sensor histidine kinase [Limnohabitans sp. Hippo3]PUE43524.1 PAS domain-containing sensor histidine kinase [Limnohabitans sp. Hippo3]